MEYGVEPSTITSAWFFILSRFKNGRHQLKASLSPIQQGPRRDVIFKTRLFAKLIAFIHEFYKVQRGWIKSWFTRGTEQEQNTLFSKFRSRLPSVSTGLPGLGYVVESGLWIARILKSFTQNSIGWLTILEDNLPDVGVSLFVIGGFLFLLGSTLILRDNWVSSLAITNCTRCWADANKSKMADLREETLAD